MSFRLGNFSLKQFSKLCEQGDVQALDTCIADVDALVSSGYLAYLESPLGKNPRTFVHVCQRLMDRQADLALRTLGLSGNCFTNSNVIKKWFYHAQNDHLELVEFLPSRWSQLNTPTLALAMGWLLHRDHYTTNPQEALGRSIPRLMQGNTLWNYTPPNRHHGKTVSRGDNGLSGLWMTLAVSHDGLHSGLLSLLMSAYHKRDELQMSPAKALYKIYRENPNAAALAYTFWMATHHMDTWKSQALPESLFWKGFSTKQRQQFEHALHVATVPLMLDALLPQWSSHGFSTGESNQDEYQEPCGNGVIDYIRMLEHTYQSITAPMEPLSADFVFDL